MFERFTERARLVVVLAQDEARTVGHNYKPDDLPGQFNELGLDGWELVLRLDDGRFVFKRPAP